MFLNQEWILTNWSLPAKGQKPPQFDPAERIFRPRVTEATRKFRALQAAPVWIWPFLAWLKIYLNGGYNS